MRTAGMNCPVCAVALAMSTREGVEIDYCPTCRGVWLDRGELDKIVERSAREHDDGPPPRAEQRSYRPDRSDDRGYRPEHQNKRRKSFFEELFD
jgi:Zn-finger nucleic acid-binding protein